MAIKVIFFGQLIEMVGASTLELDGVSDTATLQQQLHTRIPALASATYRLAVEKRVVTEITALPSGAMVALLPPFSGG